MWHSIKTWFRNKWKQIVATIGLTGVLLIGGYFAVITSINWIEHKLNEKFEKQKSEFVQKFDDMEQDLNGNIRVLQRKVDSTSEAVQANSQRIPSANFIQRLFNTQTKQFRDSVLNTIPKVIQKEMEKQNLGAGSVGSAELSIKGDTVTFSSDQDKISGYWGQIVKKEKEGDEYMYQMVLRPVDIKLTEVRTKKDPRTGQPRVYLTAIDKRTGKEIQITSTNFNFFEDKKKGFTFDPQLSATLGAVILNGENPQPVVSGSLDWLFYQGEKTRYSFLSIDANVYSDTQQIKQFTTIGLVSVDF